MIALGSVLPLFLTFSSGGTQVAPAAAAQAQTRQPFFRFEEVISSLPGFAAAEGMTSSLSAADFDGDGDVDLFLPTRLGSPDMLLVNDGGTSFSEEAAAHGLASTANDRASLWFDYDGDGRLDLVVGSDAYDPDQVLSLPDPPTTLRLYHQNGAGTFDDVTAGSGLFLDLISHPAQHVGGMAAGDLTGNGYLDLVVTFWLHQDFNQHGMSIFYNQGDGTFTKVNWDPQKSYWQPVIHDFNGDGLQDIYGAVDYEPNVLALNNGAGFVESAPLLNTDNAMNDMGVTLGDYDNDQDLDIFVTNIYYDFIPFHNVLYRYDHVAGDFDEVSEQAGVENAGWGWGCTWLDADLDGWLDLAVTNGREGNPNFFDDTSRFFWSQGGDPVTFEDVSSKVGFDDELIGSSLVSFDFDRDGDLDLAQVCIAGPMRLLRNQRIGDTKGRHSICVQPRMAGTNSHAIGATVRATVGGTTMTRHIHAGTSMMGQEPAEALFGLGDHATVDSLTIEWPGGGSTTLNGVASDQVLIVNGP